MPHVPSTEDIKRAEQWLAQDKKPLRGTTAPEALAAYSAAENERLLERLDQARAGISWRDDCLTGFCDIWNDSRLDPRREELSRSYFDKTNDMWEKEPQGLTLSPYKEAREATERAKAVERERDRLKGALQDMLKLAKMLIRYTSEHPGIVQGWRTRMDAAEVALRPEGE